MTTKRKLTKKTEHLGIIKTKEIINEANCIFNEIDTGNDIGIDAYIEIIEMEEATGCCIATQIKSGDSHLSSNDKCFIIKADKDHFEYWNSHSLPIAGIGYIPKLKKLVWCDITKYLKDNPEIISQGPYNIHISIHEELTIKNFDNFKNHFINFYSISPNEKNFIKSQNTLINYEKESNESIISSMKLLFYFHRNNKATWYFLINLFKDTTHTILIYNILYCIRHLVNHGDIFWHKWNIINTEITDYGKYLIYKNFKLDEVIKLLTLIDENGIQRGTIGQDVDAIIRNIYDVDEHLKKIAFNKAYDETIKYWALIFLVHYIHFDNLPLAKNIMKSYLLDFPDCENYDILLEIYEHIEEYGLPLY